MSSARILFLLVIFTCWALPARAGPNFDYEFESFRWTRGRWREHTLGDAWRVRVTRAPGPAALSWQADFFSQRLRIFEARKGVLAVDAAPSDCADVDLQSAVWSWIAADRSDAFRSIHPSPRGPALWESIELPHAAVRARAVERFTAQSTFLEPLPPIRGTLKSISRTPASCDLIRSACADSGPENRALPSYDLSLASETRVIDCRDVDASVAACHARIARTEARAREREELLARERNQRARCRALVLVGPATPEGAIPIEVIGSDGQPWASQLLPAPDGRVHLLAWILAPVTFVADLWTTTFELLVLCLVGMLLLMATA